MPRQRRQGVIEVRSTRAPPLAIEKAAKAKGVPSIDYDRQVKGGVASIYVSFDGRAVGVLQGKGIVAGLKAIGKYSQHPVVAELQRRQHGRNSFLFKGGYDSILKPLYKNGTFKKGPDQFVPGWDNQKAGDDLRADARQDGNKIDGVAAANDGLANAVVVALKSHGLKPIPLSGQDATPQGVQNVISGWQTMTVWKDTRVLAKAAAAAAIAAPERQEAHARRAPCERPAEGSGVHHPAGRRSTRRTDEQLYTTAS